MRYYLGYMPREVERFLDDTEPNPIKFLEDAIWFTKNSDYTVDFETKIDKDGNAEVAMIFISEKAKNYIIYEFDRTKEMILK